LPGERGLRTFGFSRALTAGILGFFWLPVQGTVLPALGLEGLPVDPLIPLIAAFALGGRPLEAWCLALGLGYVADFYTGMGSGRLILQYALVVCLATPLHGRIVLRDRWVPVVGVGALSLTSGFGVLMVLGAMGATVPQDVSSLPAECIGTGLAAFALWPALGRIGGWRKDHRMGLRGGP